MKLSKELITEMERYIKSGMSQEDCVSYLGIDRSTFYMWRKDGLKLQKLQKETLTEYEELLIDFVDTLKKAQIENKMRCVTIIQKAAETTWQAAAWFLERRYHEEYGKKETLNNNISGKIEVSKETKNWLKEIYDRTRKKDD